MLHIAHSSVNLFFLLGIGSLLDFTEPFTEVYTCSPVWSMYSSTPLSEQCSECHNMEIKGGGAGRCQTKFNFLTISFREKPKIETDQSVKPSHLDLEGRDREKHGGDNMCGARAVRSRADFPHRGSSSQTGNEQQSLERSLSCICLATVTSCVHTFFLFN